VQTAAVRTVNFISSEKRNPLTTRLMDLDSSESSVIKIKQECLAVASIARDDPSTLPGDDPFPHARMHRDRNVW